jgi:transcription antitermination factor NusG
MQKWYIIQTRPRWEKKVADCLKQKGIESYCPVKKVKRRWSDRIKTLEEPLFHTCLFAKITPEQKTEVRLTDGVVNFIYDNGKPAFVKEKEVEAFRKFWPDGEWCFDGEEENKDRLRQRQSHQLYFDKFHSWLLACMDRPKLV